MKAHNQPSKPGRFILIGAAFVCVVLIFGIGSYARQTGRLPEPRPGQPQNRKIGGRSLFASPDGFKDGDGTREHPLDLQTALSAAGPVLPGDTLWLHGGTYRGTFISELDGLESAPIVVRQVEGERATIDSGTASLIAPALYVKGAWTTYRDFEVMSSDPKRVSAETGSQPESLRRGIGIDVHGPHTQFINLVVHDMADGMGIWSDAEEAEAYGNVVYHNGWSADDRSHGHGIYTQNRTGTRRLTDNIIFDQFSHGIHAYGSDAASLDHITLVGNVVFNNGALDKRYYDRNILLGGGRMASDAVVENNYTYYTPNVRHGGENNFGYTSGCANLVARDNYFAGQWEGGAPLRMLPSCAGTMTGNVFYGPIEPWIGKAFPNNTYLLDHPTGTKVFLRRNKYDPGRAHVVVYNWDRLPELTLDLSAAQLEADANFELRDAENIFGPPVVTGKFGDGHVKVSFRKLTVAAPVGDVATPPHTAPEFAVFVLTGSSKGVWPGRLVGVVADEFRKARRFLSSSKS